MRRQSRPHKAAWRRAAARLRHDQRGATAVEYGLIIAVIVITMVAGFMEVASTTKDMWNNVSTKVINAR